MAETFQLVAAKSRAESTTSVRLSTGRPAEFHKITSMTEVHSAVDSSLLIHCSANTKFGKSENTHPSLSVRRVMWKRKLAAGPSTSLIFRDKTLYVGTTGQSIYRLNAETGATVAELALEATPVGRPAFAADSLFMFLENRSERAGYIVSVDSKLTGMRWKQKSSPDWASERPHLWKGLIIAGNCRGEVAAFRSSDGEPQWKLNVKGCIRSIGSSDDLLFVGVQEGTVYAFDLRTK
jgi:outer membrane protein assembly factor BamB